MIKDLSIPAALIAERMGLSFPEDRWADLAHGLTGAADGLGYEDPDSLIAALVSGDFGPKQVQALARCLTVPETHFFRSPGTFAMLQKDLLPELIAARRSNTRRLRIWSAGCATGPEPFSLAILVSRLLPDLADWDVSILGTDINLEGFATARKGEYTQWAFRGTPAWVMSGYFTKTREGRHRLSPAIRDLVEFRYLNLVEDPFPSDCDLILCRNVIMYFSRDTAVQVADKLRGALREGGYLLVTASETGRDIQGALSSSTLGGEIVYRRTPPETRTSCVNSAHTAPASTRDEHADASADRSSRGKRARKSQPAKRQVAEPRRSRAATPRPEQGDLRLERRAYSRDTQRIPAPAAAAEAGAAAEEARKLADRGSLDEALARCTEALACEKLNPSLYYLKASILQELGRSEEAEQALQSMLFLDGDFAPARVMLGAIARSQARSGEAAKHFREALALLERMPSDSVLAETDGLTAGEMVETVASLIENERVS